MLEDDRLESLAHQPVAVHHRRVHEPIGSPERRELNDWEDGLRRRITEEAATLDALGSPREPAVDDFA
jgi:hypothetical protein